MAKNLSTNATIIIVDVSQNTGATLLNAFLKSHPELGSYHVPASELLEDYFA